MPTVYTRNTSLDQKIQFILWTNPAHANHPVTTHPNVTVMARTMRDTINTDKPPGFPNYTNNSTYYSSQNAINIGKRLADWFEYQGLTKGKGEKYYNGLYGGGIFVQNWGDINWSPKGLMKNPNDQVSGYNVGFHANAILRNQGTLPDGSLTLADFISLVFQTMKSECDNRNLCYPLYLAWDMEDVIEGAGLVGTQDSPGSNLANQGNNSLPNQINSLQVQFSQGSLSQNPNYQSPLPPIDSDLGNQIPGSAPWLACIASPKYSTEIVYEEWDGSSWIGKTMADAYAAAGFPQHNPSSYWFSGTINQNWLNKMKPYFLRMIDHAFSKALYEPAKEVFPNIICGNYGVLHGISSTQNEQYWEIQNNWNRIPSVNFNKNRYLKADYQSPYCYAPNMQLNLSSRYNPAYNVSYPAPEGFGHIFGPTKREVYRNYATQLVRHCIVGDNPIPCIPWVEPPGEGATRNVFADTYIPDSSDILYVLQQHYLAGVRTWIMFNPSHGDSSPEGLTKLDDFLKTINEFNKWIASQTKTARIRMIS